jgi:hypothetical protein
LVTIFFVSIEKGAGKTALCSGLARNLLESGRRVDYLKLQPSHDEKSDDDVSYMRKIIKNDNYQADDIPEEKDVLLVETGLDVHNGVNWPEQVYETAGKMQASVIAVETYAAFVSKRHNLSPYLGFGEKLTGIIINKTPARLPLEIKERMKADLTASGIKLLGYIPENRLMMAVTLGELAEKLDGTILNNHEKSGELVENYMIGALVVDSGTSYFNRLPNKAAIIRKDRPDMQLAALETPLNCLILGKTDGKPVYNVMHKAQRKGVPVITTGLGIPEIAASIDDIILHSKATQQRKTECMGSLIKNNLNMAAVTAG